MIRLRLFHLGLKSGRSTFNYPSTLINLLACDLVVYAYFSATPIFRTRILNISKKCDFRKSTTSISTSTLVLEY